MTETLIILLMAFGLFGCQSKQNTDNEIDNETTKESLVVEPDADEFIAKNNDWDYQPLYGAYLHESNTKGFTGILDITAEGNDLTFSLSVQKQECSGQINGTIGMAIHNENQYAGFYDNADCRMEFIFNLSDNSIRITEVGICRLLEGGCRFGGTYRKKN